MLEWPPSPRAAAVATSSGFGLGRTDGRREAARGDLSGTIGDSGPVVDRNVESGALVEIQNIL